MLAYAIRHAKIGMKLGVLYADAKHKTPNWFEKNKWELECLLDAYRNALGHLYWDTKPVLPQNMTFDLKFFKFVFDDQSHFVQLQQDNDLG